MTPCHKLQLPKPVKKENSSGGTHFRNWMSDGSSRSHAFSCSGVERPRGGSSWNRGGLPTVTMLAILVRRSVQSCFRSSLDTSRLVPDGDAATCTHAPSQMVTCEHPDVTSNPGSLEQTWYPYTTTCKREWCQ